MCDERARALPRGVPFETEQRVRGKDGQYRWYLVRHYALRDDQGRLTRWYATGADIDDRKRAEERMHSETLALREDLDQGAAAKLGIPRQTLDWKIKTYNIDKLAFRRR